MPQLVAAQTFTAVDIGITGNGKYTVYQSAEISTNNNKAVEVDLAIHSFLPNRQGLGRALLTMILERKDDAGNWHPLHALHAPVQAIAYDETENGGIIPNQHMTFGPSVFQLEGDRAWDTSDGLAIISQDHQKRGVMPSKFRIKVLVHEGQYGYTGAFDSVTISLDYELRAE